MQHSELVLVTGGTGFIAAHTIIRLLQKGYTVRTTLRSMNRKEDALAMLKAGGATSLDRVSFLEADLTKDDNWVDAMSGCTYVLNVASPIFHGKDTNEADMIKMVTDGALRILRAARDAGVKRVVMTSSFGAVGFSNTDPNTQTTEEAWTAPDQKNLSPYEKSKGLSERTAWKFIAEQGGRLELSVINPVAVLGPTLRADTTGSFGLLTHLMDGSMKAVPNIPLNIVDVRDVADLHICAMIEPKAKGERFLALADGKISMPEIASLLRKERPEAARKVGTGKVPDWVLKVAALFNHEAKLAAPLLSINRNVSNDKARRLLGWKPRFSKEEAILASVDSMIKFGVVK